MRAAILAVGSEITSGQILNRNAQWLSARLWKMGVPTASHVAVPDERDLIIQALRTLSAQAELLFITGGLGPTSDDFTRDVIAEWANCKMIFNDEAWAHLCARLGARGIPAKDIHRQECYFPPGAKIYLNPVGTACGFALDVGTCRVYVLPGPPREIEGIWQDFLASELAERTRSIDAGITRSWDCIGLPESELAEKVEAALSGCRFEKAYRVHLPYVEFKLSFRRSEEAEATDWCARITELLRPWLIVQDGADPAAELAARLTSIAGQIAVVDEFTAGGLMQRLIPCTRTLLTEGRLQFYSCAPKVQEAELTLGLSADGSQITASTGHHGGGHHRTVQLPPMWKTMPDRQRLFSTEMAIITWCEFLKTRP